MKENSFNILAFETSCDDTSVAVINDRYEVLSNLISSQTQHEEFGGVVPEIASRLHLKNIVSLTHHALEKSGVTLSDIDAVAVSVNPGLIGSLLVGLSFAKGLAWSRGLPLITVNHMVGHIYANVIENPDLSPPFAALVVSGGHTELVHFHDWENFEIIGRTLDDAAGEAFDKTAKLLNLGYPGGPVIDKLAKKGNPDFHHFPRALNVKDNFDFSFSGLKTAIMTYVRDKDEAFLEVNKANIAASLQEAIIEILVKKTIQYTKKARVKQVVLAGGVSANSGLRALMESECAKLKVRLYYPPLKLCMDNAAMIGAAAIIKYKRSDFAQLDANAFSTKGLRNI
ncbi:MAG: tRNA (adenosine(37)-N6)-threonylcarbamoyltransferase complex transferase subunit TsaD [Candidatus Cloacimonetes bacterium]|nr:tRNA (adenosine(37)-N6)-threonylcarbamoyltransferase complex transferase subunit TsaD [Candidatus Cloacimonadota bacterium]